MLKAKCYGCGAICRFGPEKPRIWTVMFGWFKRKPLAPIQIEITIKVEPIQVRLDGLQIQANRPEDVEERCSPVDRPSGTSSGAPEPEISIPSNLASPAVRFGKQVEGTSP